MGLRCSLAEEVVAVEDEVSAGCGSGHPKLHECGGYRSYAPEPPGVGFGDEVGVVVYHRILLCGQESRIRCSLNEVVVEIGLPSAATEGAWLAFARSRSLLN